MLKRRILVLSVVIILVGVGSAPVQSVFLSAQEFAALSEANDSKTSGATQANTQTDNALVRVIKAPFKAIGKLFGREKNANKLRRLSEKDVQRFESAPVTRINDATSIRSAERPSSDISAAQHLEQGRALLNQGNVNAAIAELSLAASMDPKLADAYNLLGVAYHNKGLFQMSTKSFETALKIDKNNAQILNNFGYLQYLDGDYHGAIERLKKATRLDPNDARILNNLALAQSRIGKFDDAYKNFARAGGEINGTLNVANRLELAGRSDEARKFYDAAKRAAEAERKIRPNSQTITVAVEVRNGHVINAMVANPRPGLESYEASALRIARQRRYPEDKSGHESVVVKVVAFPPS